MRLLRRCSVIVFCASALSFTAFAAEEDAVAEKIRTAEGRLAQAEMSRDISAMTELYADDVVLFPPGEEPLRGKSAVLRWMNRRRNSNVKPTRESFEMTSLDVCGDFAIESGRAKRTQYLSIWKRQPDGVWRIQKDMWNGQESPSEAAVKAPAAAVSSPQSAPPEVIAPVSDTIPIPDPRPLSEGFARGIGDQLRTRAAKIRLLRTTGGSEDARRAATTRADRELQKIIRNIGWIDVNRFGVRTSCDAAYIVAESGDPALVRSTVPLMKDLEQNPEGNGCYQPALEAYRKIAGR